MCYSRLLCFCIQPHTKVTDFECQTYSVGGEVALCGFIDLVHVGSPAAVSRHLVLPFSASPATTPAQVPAAVPASGSAKASMPTVKVESSDEEDDSPDDGRTPSFCVLLHGALKVGKHLHALDMQYSRADDTNMQNCSVSGCSCQLLKLPFLSLRQKVSFPKLYIVHNYLRFYIFLLYKSW